MEEGSIVVFPVPEDVFNEDKHGSKNEESMPICQGGMEDSYTDLLDSNHCDGETECNMVVGEPTHSDEPSLLYVAVRSTSNHRLQDVQSNVVEEGITMASQHDPAMSWWKQQRM